MRQQHHIDRELNPTTRAVKGRPGVREVIGAYRPVEWGVGGPYVLVDPHGGRESPRMTEPIAYHPPSSGTRSSAGTKRVPEAPGTVTSKRRRGSAG